MREGKKSGKNKEMDKSRDDGRGKELVWDKIPKDKIVACFLVPLHMGTEPFTFKVIRGWINFNNFCYILPWIEKGSSLHYFHGRPPHRKI